MRSHAAFVVAFALLQACGGSTEATSPTVASVAGTYTLATANGKALPFADPAGNVTVLSGNATLRADKTFSQEQMIQFAPGPPFVPVLTHSEGTFAVTSAGTIEFVTTGGAHLSGTVSANGITMPWGAATFSYLRH
jgi:hypothetical protein